MLRAEITHGIILKQSNYFIKCASYFDLKVIHILVTFAGMQNLLKFGILVYQFLKKSRKPVDCGSNET